MESLGLPEKPKQHIYTAVVPMMEEGKSASQSDCFGSDLSNKSENKSNFLKITSSV